MSYGSDWACRRCGWGNLDVRSQCRNCGEPAPAREAAPAAPKITAWMPEQDRLRLAWLGKLIEECNELSARAARCIMQGLDALDPKSFNANRFELAREMADVTACIQFAEEQLGACVDQGRVTEKVGGYYEWHKLIAATQEASHGG